MKDYESKDNLIEAAKAFKKIEKLKKTLRTKKNLEKTSKFIKDKKTVDDAYNTQVTLFNTEWDEKKKKLFQDLRKEEEKLKEKYKEEKKNLKEKVYKSFKPKPKPDQEYLKLKQVKSALIKQKEYDKAVEYDQKLKSYAAKQQVKFEEIKNNKVELEAERLEKSLQRDLENFDKRKKLEIFEFQRKREKEFGHLEKRYKNTSNHLLLSQKTLKRRISESEKLVNQSCAKANSPQAELEKPGNPGERSLQGDESTPSVA